MDVGMRIVLVTDEIKNNDEAVKLAGITSDATIVVHDASILPPSELALMMDQVSLFGNPEIHILKYIPDITTRDAILDVFATSNPSDVWICIVSSITAKLKKDLESGGVKIIEKKSAASAKKGSGEPDVFALVRAYESGDKKKTWVTYESLIRANVAPEQLVGILFWKTKDIISKGASGIKKQTTVSHARSLATLFHESRITGAPIRERLEQFLLSI